MSCATYVFICTAALVVIASAQREAYCNLKSCRGKPNTVCKYPFGVVSRTCGKVLQSKLTNADKAEILKVHNELRDKVARGQESLGNPGPQPPSKNIVSLQWSDELAAIAQTWANQCKYGHDECRNTPAGYVGQNVASSSAYGQAPNSLGEMVKSWSMEVKNFNRNIVSSFKPAPENAPATGHYTQMVWGETTHVGCGVVVYNNDGIWTNRYLVCNYAPGGNVLGMPVY